MRGVQMRDMHETRDTIRSTDFRKPSSTLHMDIIIGEVSNITGGLVYFMDDAMRLTWWYGPAQPSCTPYQSVGHTLRSAPRFVDPIPVYTQGSTHCMYIYHNGAHQRHNLTQITHHLEMSLLILFAVWNDNLRSRLG